MELESYIVGFIDGEGCFSVSFSKRNKMKMGIEVRPSFSVSQHLRNKKILHRFRRFFKCGSIRFSRRDQTYKYEVRSTSELVEKVIPHFKKYPLQTSKAQSFRKFCEICRIIQQGNHLSPKGMKKVILLSEEVNKTGLKKYDRRKLLKLIAR